MFSDSGRFHDSHRHLREGNLAQVVLVERDQLGELLDRSTVIKDSHDRANLRGKKREKPQLRAFHFANINIS
jgi:hypothetical protein